jgi:hypothetical protein
MCNHQINNRTHKGTQPLPPLTRARPRTPVVSCGSCARPWAWTTARALTRCAERRDGAANEGRDGHEQATRRQGKGRRALEAEGAETRRRASMQDIGIPTTESKGERGRRPGEGSDGFGGCCGASHSLTPTPPALPRTISSTCSSQRRLSPPTQVRLCQRRIRVDGRTRRWWGGYDRERRERGRKRGQMIAVAPCSCWFPK